MNQDRQIDEWLIKFWCNKQTEWAKIKNIEIIIKLPNITIKYSN